MTGPSQRGQEAFLCAVEAWKQLMAAPTSATREASTALWWQACEIALDEYRDGNKRTRELG